MTSAIHGSPWLRYGDGTIYRGEQAQEVAPASLSMPSRSGAELRIYDGEGRLAGIISSEWGTQNLLHATATVTTSGPESLSFRLAELPTWTMTVGTRVDLHLDGSASPIWSGYLQEVPSALSTERPYEYRAAGWRLQLSGIIIASQAYSRWRIYQVVGDLLRTYVEPRTGIVLDPSQVSTAARYMLGDYRAERATLTSVLDDLRDMAGLYLWGVDAQRRFFFRPESQDVNRHWWVGQHVTRCTASLDGTKLANRIWIKMGKRLPLSDDQWVQYPLEDLSSQAAYGIREASITAPSVYTEGDAVRMASVTLAERREPILSLSLSGLTYTGPIACEGRARVVSADGTTEEIRPIEEVTYTVTGAGIEVEVDLGDRQPDVGRWLAGWSGQQTRLEQLQQAAQRQTEASA